MLALVILIVVAGVLGLIAANGERRRREARRSARRLLVVMKAAQVISPEVDADDERIVDALVAKATARCAPRRMRESCACCARRARP